MTALMGTFCKISTMADGTPRIVLDLQCSLSEIAALGLIPGVPFAIARLTKESAGAPVVPVEPEQKTKVGQLCLMACTFCADPNFLGWITDETSFDADNEAEAKNFILRVCAIESRKELDTNPRAANTFHSQIRIPFLAWKADCSNEGRA